MRTNRDILKNLTVNITDGEHASVVDELSGKFYLLSNKNIVSGRIIIDELDRKISKESFDKINRRTKLEKKDVVVSSVGTIGKVAIIKHQNINFDFQRSVGIIKCDMNKLLPEYLYYYINLPFVQKRLVNLSKGAVQKCLFINDLQELIIDYPSEIENQHKMTGVLSVLDSKIEFNNRINAELESMAKTIFDYWFVQFDFPNEKGKPYKSSGGKMVWNKELKREIPEGWEVGTLLDIAEYINGLPCQKFRPIGNDSLKVIKIKEMHEGFSSETEFVRPDIPQKAIIENGDVLFSWSASLEVQIWSRGKGALNQHIFKVTSDNYPKSFYYYQLLNYLQHFKMMAANRKTTMGHITQEHLEQSRIVFPSEKWNHLISECEAIIAPILEKKIINEIENQQLSELRDWLLPMLMNGQVSVVSN